MSHAGIRNILFNVVNDSDIEAKGRSYGTRFLSYQRPLAMEIRTA